MIGLGERSDSFKSVWSGGDPIGMAYGVETDLPYQLGWLKRPMPNYFDYEVSGEKCYHHWSIQI